MWKMSLDPLMLRDELSPHNMRTKALQMRPQSNTEQKHCTVKQQTPLRATGTGHTNNHHANFSDGGLYQTAKLSWQALSLGVQSALNNMCVSFWKLPCLIAV